MTTVDQPVGVGGPVGRTVRGVFERAARNGAVTLIAVPLAAVVAALVVGAVLIALEGEEPLAVYRTVFEGVVTRPRGFSDTATAATPLILIGMGYATAYRANVFTIGAEGQYLVGAVAGVAWATASGISSLPAVLLITTGLIVAVAAGALWSGLAGWLDVRFGASIVISSLMLVYVAGSILQWAVRTGIRDPESFIPASRPVGDAELPTLPGTSTHLGFLFALVIVPVAAWFLARHRSGYRIAALGHNRDALDANEVRSGHVVILVMLVAGGLAGLAGFVEISGGGGRLGPQASLGYGFTAIVVALVGRLHPVGVLIASLGLAALTIGFESSQRIHSLPSSLVGVIMALTVIFVVVGDALTARFQEVR